MVLPERRLRDLIKSGLIALSFGLVIASNSAQASIGPELQADRPVPKLSLPFFVAASHLEGVLPALVSPGSNSAPLSAGPSASGQFFSVSLPFPEAATETLRSIARYWKHLDGSSLSQRKRTSPMMPREVLGSVALVISNAPLTQRWRAVLQEEANSYFEGECQAERAACGSKLRRQLVETVSLAQRQDDQAAIRSINAAVNGRLKYRTDMENYGTPDYWATAGELLQRGTGDCKGYAILKMWMLLAAGFDRSQIRLQLVKIPATGQDHAILVVNTTEGQIVLDNLAAGTRNDTEVKEYKPLLSFIEGQTYIHGLKRTSISS
ncbi:transglutaminase-like cysteine peptidase [Bosea beijingensis]